MIQATCTNEEKVKITLNPVSKYGTPEALDGKPSWEVTEGTATVEPSEDGLSAYLVSGEPGLSKIKVTADADLGEGVQTVSDEIEFYVLQAQAETLGFEVSPAEQK